MSDRRPFITRRQMLALSACVGAAALIPSISSANELVTTEQPPNPTGMLTSISEDVHKTRTAGPSWIASSANSNLKTFLRGNGTTYLNPAYKVIDISEHNGNIDWDVLAASDVDGAIIRLGFGWDTNLEISAPGAAARTNVDKQLDKNIKACNRLGIPYGLYLYSYAEDADFAENEAVFTIKLIERYGCKPTLPIFYDLEKWTWTGHTPPNNVSTYEAIVKRYCDVMHKGGYANVRVYSYRAYLTGALAPLSSSAIWEKAAWAAEYGNDLQFSNPYFDGCLAWQYTSEGSVPGISGNVDINAFPPFYKLAFGDVTTMTPHHEDIWWLTQNGITTGFEDRSFRGMSAVARQDMAAFLYRLAGSPDYSPSSSDQSRFLDVSSSTPHYKEICWLASTGITEGFADGTFRGMSPVARQDMAAFLCRFAAKFINSGHASWAPSNSDIIRFPDVNSSTPHCNDIWWLGAMGISTGFEDGTFRGMSSVTRQDMAAFLHRIMSLN